MPTAELPLVAQVLAANLVIHSTTGTRTVAAAKSWLTYSRVDDATTFNA